MGMGMYFCAGHEILVIENFCWACEFGHENFLLDMIAWQWKEFFVGHGIFGHEIFFFLVLENFC